VKACGSPTEMQLLRHSEKRPEVSQLHAGMISRNELVVSESILDGHACRTLNEGGRSKSTERVGLTSVWIEEHASMYKAKPRYPERLERMTGL
jgi:hypothetical protein